MRRASADPAEGVFAFSGRLGKATWFVGTWGYLVAAYFAFGALYAGWLSVAHASGVGLLLAVPAALILGPIFGAIGVAASFPTLVVAPLYLALLRRIPPRWGPRIFRLAAIVLAPPVVGSLAFVWWFREGPDWFFVRSLVAVLVIYGLVIPSPFEYGEHRRHWWHLPSSGRRRRGSILGSE